MAKATVNKQIELFEVKKQYQVMFFDERNQFTAISSKRFNTMEEADIWGFDHRGKHERYSLLTVKGEC